MPTLLVVDDDAAIRECFRLTFHEPEVTLHLAATAGEGLHLLADKRPDAAILDIDLPDMSGLELYRKIRDVDAKIPVIFMTGHGTAETAIEAMSLGAYEYLLKPLDLDQLTDLVTRAFHISQLMRVPAKVAEAEYEGGASELLVGRSPAMQEVYKAIGRVAPFDVTVLVRGESGTGKELVARAIYHYSRRVDKPFLAINCAAIPETLLESELFGHEKGSFTGADRRRIGKFEQCSGGTLFLDEIGDMSLVTQAKILRVLQDGQFERVGGNELLTANVRLIAATNRDLEKQVSAGEFRADLFYRLNVYTITIPPVRDRGDDLMLLADHFLRRFNHDLGKSVNRIAPEALDLLRHYSWPGNVRELQSILKQALLQATGPVLMPEFLPALIRNEAKSEVSADAKTLAPAEDGEWRQFVLGRLRAGSVNLYAEWQEATDRQLLTVLLEHTHGNQSHIARILGISRSTLRAKLQTLGLLDEKAHAQEPPG
jgi:two-component system nitrogen regulation response regulator GlnG